MFLYDGLSDLPRLYTHEHMEWLHPYERIPFALNDYGDNSQQKRTKA